MILYNSSTPMAVFLRYMQFLMALGCIVSVSCIATTGNIMGFHKNVSIELQYQIERQIQCILIQSDVSHESNIEDTSKLTLLCRRGMSGPPGF